MDAAKQNNAWPFKPVAPAPEAANPGVAFHSGDQGIAPQSPLAYLSAILLSDSAGFSLLTAMLPLAYSNAVGGWLAT